MSFEVSRLLSKIKMNLKIKKLTQNKYLVEVGYNGLGHYVIWNVASLLSKYGPLYMLNVIRKPGFIVNK